MQTKTITANGLEFTYLEAGTGDNVVLCLHGFPDTPHTWSDLMARLSEAGYRVIAPFMRGYPPTQAAPDGKYSIKELATDAIGLLDAFEVEQAVIIGHDWGALAAYGAVALVPERFSKLVTIAIPHPRALSFGPRTLIKGRHFLNFQRRKSSIAWMQRDNYAAISSIFKRWSPNWKFTDADVAPVRESLSQAGGVEASLGYYWSFFSGRSDPQVQNLLRAKTTVPTLSLFGDADGALVLDALNRTESAYEALYQQEVLPGVGHFLHRETPDTVADLILDFFIIDS